MTIFEELIWFVFVMHLGSRRTTFRLCAANLKNTGRRTLEESKYICMCMLLLLLIVNRIYLFFLIEHEVVQLY